MIKWLLVILVFILVLVISRIDSHGHIIIPLPDAEDLYDIGGERIKIINSNNVQPIPEAGYIFVRPSPTIEKRLGVKNSAQERQANAKKLVKRAPVAATVQVIGSIIEPINNFTLRRILQEDTRYLLQIREGLELSAMIDDRFIYIDMD